MEKEAMQLQPTGKNKYGSGELGEVEPEEYDPHTHRTVPHPTSNNETLIHILKGSLGTGI
ncbi:proton-coupled amino acid transporter-like protein pathetic, partial [Agrilus planipennis]|uniref:Proton-coupled amino acid transporter-like protein pathetic n=1 Tax=Agrilus planipennis TaxID=224129 RepID=A0A7F5RLV2_AGRPL